MLQLLKSDDFAEAGKGLIKATRACRRSKIAGDTADTAKGKSTVRPARTHFVLGIVRSNVSV
jgi:hypothetical protein